MYKEARWSLRGVVPLGVVVSLGVLLGCMVFAAAALAGDANEASCPAATEASLGFRAYLPDCRAYEQVTPVFKDGSELELEVLSEGGLSVIARTLGTFAGLENNTNLSGGTYELSRSASGWTVAAISPPSSVLPVQEFYAASPELESTLWLARTASESIAAENLYIREADGTLVKIGSLLPPAAVKGPPSGEFGAFLFKTEAEYVDASADFSHVLFKIERGQEFGIAWPGDATNGLSSLYEYSGVNQTRPELVGVNNEGQMISTCATWLGSLNSGDVYNAMSADGGTVFFTAEERGRCGASAGPEVDELFARVDDRETVGISEPSTGAGGACGACNESARSSAEFAGASEDGSKVFFLTSQELLSGAKGENLYEYDFDGPPGPHVSLVSSDASGNAEVQGVARVSEDGSHVYFVARGRLSEGPRGGKEVEDKEGEMIEGPCLAELDAGEKAAETAAEEEEAKAEPVTTGARCRPMVGEDNLYVFQRDAQYPGGHVSFIATLENSDKKDWNASDRRRVQATPDGRFLVFRSAADLTAGDTSSVQQLFEYDAVTGELVQVSKAREGYEPKEAKLSADENEAEIPVQGYSVHTSPAVAGKVTVSGDGSTVVFSSRGALTAEAEVAAAAKVESTYEYRSSVASGGSIGEGEVFLLSGEGTQPSPGVEGMDGSGDDVFFVTSAALASDSGESQFNTFDARVDGGFLAADPPVGCVAEACGEPLVVAPVGESVTGGASVPAGAGVPAGSVPAAGIKKPAVVLSRRERLARALRACIRVRRGRRVACEAAAIKKYGAHKKKSVGSARGGK